MRQTDQVELPTLTFIFIEQIRPGGKLVIERALLAIKYFRAIAVLYKNRIALKILKELT